MPALACFLLAESSRFMSLGRKFRRGNAPLEIGDVVITLLAVAAIGLIAWGLYHWVAIQQRRVSNSPGRLFRELCQAHRLNWTNRRLLTQLASWRGIEHPARLFLEPEWFDSSTLSPALEPEREGIERLRDQIFGRRIDQATGA